MKKVLLMALVVAVAAVFTVRAEDAAATPAKAEVKAACTSCAGCKATKDCAACKEGGGMCATCMGKKCHVLAIKDGKVQCCPCPKDCKCTVKEGETKCSCGKDVKTVDLKGKFVCGCAAGCSCNQISAKPGKCGCGKDMTEVK